MIETWNLQRKTDKDGHLVYERVKHLNGSGYQISVTEGAKG